MRALAYAVLAAALLTGSIWTALGTRTFQHTWSMHWRPTLVPSAYMLIMLPVTAVGYLVLLAATDHATWGNLPAQSWTASPSLDPEMFRRATRMWAAEHGFETSFNIFGTIDGVDIVSFTLMPTSSFERVQASWTAVNRPVPPFSVTYLRSTEPGESEPIIVLELPFAGLHSLDEYQWQKTIDEFHDVIAPRTPDG